MRIQHLLLLGIIVLILGCIQEQAIVEEGKIIMKDTKELALKEEDISKEEWYYTYHIYHEKNVYEVKFESKKYLADVTFQRNALENRVYMYPNITDAKNAYSDIKKYYSKKSGIKEADFGTESFISSGALSTEIIFRQSNVIAGVKYVNYVRYADEEIQKTPRVNRSMEENEAIKYARIIEQRVKEAAS